jgi:hypothetical protein
MANKKTTQSRRELRSLRMKQLLFVGLGIMIILSMVLSLLTTY